MQGDNLQVADWAQQLARLVVLAGCVAMAAESPRPKINILPAVEAQDKSERKPRKGNLSPEVREFMRLPPHIQRQVLDYAKNWISASFESTD